MLRRAYEKGLARSEEAKSASDLLTVVEFGRFEECWATFLMKYCGVFTILEQGAKVSEESSYWFGLVKSQIKKDPMLSYLKQARNSEEHGLEAVILKQPSTMRLENRRPLMDIYVSYNEAGEIKFSEPRFGLTSDVKGLPERMILRDVVDGRSGKVYRVPEKHLSEEILDNSPAKIASMAINFCRSTLESAEKLVVDRT